MKPALKTYLPEWSHDWLEVMVHGVQILLILVVAWMLQRLLRRVITKAGEHYGLPVNLVRPAVRLLRWLIVAGALLMVLERLGVSATVLWTAFTGFATVGAVAFFAAWSVLSNLFCAILIFTARPFRLGDHIELLDAADKPGAKGEVVDINMLYTTIEDSSVPERGVLLQIPNALVFQRVIRRWRAGVSDPQAHVPVVTPPKPAPTAEAAPESAQK